MISDTTFKEYLGRIGFNSLEINLIMLAGKTTINTAKTLAEVEQNFKSKLDTMFSSGKKIPKASLKKAINDLIFQNQKVIKKNLEEIYNDKLRRSTDPATKFKASKLADQIAQSYTDEFNKHIENGLTVSEVSDRLKYKSDLISSTEASRLTAEESDYQLALKKTKRVWSSILDSKTCKICRRLNGKVTTKSPVKDTHCRCRCIIIFEVI